MKINVPWSDIKSFFVSRDVGLQWIVANNQYYLFASDGPMEVTAQIPMDGSASDDQTDFETNYKNDANKPLLPIITTVTTQYEINNKDLKLAKGVVSLTVGQTSGTLSIKVPGTFGSSDGRWVAGGYAITEIYDPNDYVTVDIVDTDRCVAWAVALAMDPSATAPLADADIIAAGVLPGIGQAFPNYPLIKTYNDSEQPADNQGWFFWPLARGNGLSSCGECEVNPIGGYGFMPAGLYISLTYYRPCALAGSMRVNLDWGKKE